jgi:hypothetical protein
MTIAKVEGTFNATGSSASVRLANKCNLLIEGGDGVVQLERSVTGTAGPFFPISRDSSGAIASYTTDAGNPVGFNGTFEEPEDGGHHYRLTCTTYNSGNINYRIGR